MDCGKDDAVTSKVLTHEDALIRFEERKCLFCNGSLGLPKLFPQGRYFCPVSTCDKKLFYREREQAFICVDHRGKSQNVHTGYCDECGEVWSLQRVLTEDFREVLELPQLPNPRREPNPHSNVRTRGW